MYSEERTIRGYEQKRTVAGRTAKVVIVVKAEDGVVRPGRFMVGGMADTRVKYLIREVAPESLDCTSSTAISGRGNPDPQIISVSTARKKVPHVMDALDRATTSAISPSGLNYCSSAERQTISDHGLAAEIIFYHSAHNLPPQTEPFLPNRTPLPLSPCLYLQPGRCHIDRTETAPRRKTVASDDKILRQTPVTYTSTRTKKKEEKNTIKQSPLDTPPTSHRPSPHLPQPPTPQDQPSLRSMSIPSSPPLRFPVLPPLRCCSSRRSSAHRPRASCAARH